jgi:hypothetical protein
MMLVIDGFLQLLDRLIDLLEAKKRRKRELFSEIIEPIFNEVQPVVDEYFKFFQEARQRLQKAKATDYRRLVQELTKERKDFHSVRVKVTHLTEAIREQTRLEQVKEFAKAVEELFDATVISKPTREQPGVKRQVSSQIRRSPGTKRKELIDRLEKAREVPVEKEALLRYIDEALEAIDEAFSKVAARYATLRLASL